MKFHSFLIVLICSTASKSAAQPFDLGSWNILNVQYKYSDKLSVFGEAQLRSLKFYNHFHYYEYKGGVNYNLHKQLRLTLGAGSYQTYKEGGDFVLPKNNDEFRLWPQVTFFQELFKFKMEQRYRAEMRWTSNGYRSRFRYRIGIARPFGDDSKGYKPFQVSFSNELFFTDHEPYFERNRMQFTFQYKASAHATMQIGYLHQFDYRINDETGRDFLVLGLYCDLFRKTSAKTDEDIKDN